MAFPPWKPNTASEIASMDSCGKIENEAESNIEMSILVKELNTLKALCSAAVSPRVLYLLFHTIKMTLNKYAIPWFAGIQCLVCVLDA